MKLLFALLIMSLSTTALAKDVGQWENTDPAVREWYRSLKQPDNRELSCCDLADAYWADEIHVNEKGETVATITDDRDDAPLGRPHVPVGTQVIIPNHKLKFDSGNPTGHNIVFLSAGAEKIVFCFVQGTGI